MDGELKALSLKDEINANHRECIRSGNETINYAVQAGELLQQVKAAVPHGEFQKWVEQFCDFSHDVANGYMKLHRDLLPFSKSERARILDDAASVTNLRKLLKPRENSDSAPRNTPPSGSQDSTETVVPEVDPEEFVEKPPTKPSKPPKQLDRSAWFKLYEQQIGPQVRLVDKIAAAIGESGSEEHKTVQEHLNIATEQMMEWMEVEK